MKISVITCTYNSSSYIEDTMKSIWEQQKEYPFEQIIVDACSTDNTLAIVENYKAKHPIKIFKREPQGISDAMNFGIQQASGDAIQILHSDDYNIDDRIYEKAAAALKDSPWVYGFTKTVNDSGDLIATQPHPLFAKYSYLKLMCISFIPHPSAFVAKQVFEDYGYFRDDLKITMDYEFWIRIGKTITPKVLPEYWCAFRAHEDSLSTANITSDRMLKERKLIFELNHKFPKKQFAICANFCIEYLVRSLYHFLKKGK